MHIEPKYDDIKEDYESGVSRLIWSTTIADLETPVSALLKLTEDEEWCFLLESVTGGETRGRYSIIGMHPDIIWRVREGKAEQKRLIDPIDSDFMPHILPPMDALREFLFQSRLEIPAHLPPMIAGVFGYMGYEMVHFMEDIPSTQEVIEGLPDSIFMRPTIIVVFDSVCATITIASPIWAGTDMAAHIAYARGCDSITRALEKLDSPLKRQREKATHMGMEEGEDMISLLSPTSNMSPESYMENARKAKEYIAAGDIFQVVLSQRFEIPFTLPPISLYRALRRVNPSPFLYYLNFKTFSLIGSSPEILVRVRDGKVTIRPLAGTRPRGKTAEEDRALAEDLLSDPKERAEHLMLLDLGRNDVGRVAEIGSVRVPNQFSLEYYSQVMHISSTVEGDLSQCHDVISALCAGFPAGTVSGAPKVRAMEIIAELEKEKRGPYAGCVGYFSANGHMDSCIVLRTAIVKDGRMFVQAGAGIVADSDPQKEHQECMNKAKALFRAAEEASKQSFAVERGQ